MDAREENEIVESRDQKSLKLLSSCPRPRKAGSTRPQRKQKSPLRVPSPALLREAPLAFTTEDESSGAGMAFLFVVV